MNLLIFTGICGFVQVSLFNGSGLTERKMLKGAALNLEQGNRFFGPVPPRLTIRTLKDQLPTKSIVNGVMSNKRQIRTR